MAITASVVLFCHVFTRRFRTDALVTRFAASRLHGRMLSATLGDCECFQRAAGEEGLTVSEAPVG